MEQFLTFVACIFKVDVSLLSLDTEYQSIPEWDSLMHIRLVMEIEEEYDVEISLDQVTEIKSLAAFYQMITREEKK